jgi:surface antigen
MTRQGLRGIQKSAGVVLSLSLTMAAIFGVAATAAMIASPAYADTYSDLLAAQKKQNDAKAQDAKLKQQLAGVNKDLADKIIALNDLTNTQIPAAEAAAYQAGVQAASAQQAADEAAQRYSAAQDDLATMEKQIAQSGKDYDLAQAATAEAARTSMHGSSSASDAVSLMTGSTSVSDYVDSIQSQQAISRKASSDADNAALDLSTSLTREQRLNAIQEQIADLKATMDAQNADAQKAKASADAENNALMVLYQKVDDDRAQLEAQQGQLKTDEAKEAAGIVAAQAEVAALNKQWAKEQAESVANAANNASQNQGSTNPPATDTKYPPYNGHPTGDYGYNAYPFSQCTWYVYNRRHQLGLPVGSYFGNGWQWANSARALGYQVDNNPAVGAIMVFARGQLGASAAYGHVAVVERVNADGTVTTSECGATYYGHAFSRTIGNVHSFQYIHN